MTPGHKLMLSKQPPQYAAHGHFLCSLDYSQACMFPLECQCLGLPGQRGKPWNRAGAAFCVELLLLDSSSPPSACRIHPGTFQACMPEFQECTAYAYGERDPVWGLGSLSLGIQTGSDLCSISNLHQMLHRKM